MIVLSSLPKRVLHSVRSSASFKFQYPLSSVRSSSSCLGLLPLLPAASILPCIFPSITSFRKQFPCIMRPKQLAFLSSLTLSNGSSFLSRSVHPCPAPHISDFQILLIYFRSVRVSALYKAMDQM